MINSLGPGEAERSLAEMLPHFRRANIQPAVVCPGRRREEIHPPVESRGTEVMLLAATSLVRLVIALRKIILERRPDIVHTACADLRLNVHAVLSKYSPG